MRLIEIATVIRNRSEGRFFFRDEVEAMLKTMDLTIEFWREPGVLQKEFLQIAGGDAVTGSDALDVLKEILSTQVTHDVVDDDYLIGSLFCSGECV